MITDEFVEDDDNMEIDLDNTNSYEYDVSYYEENKLGFFDGDIY